MEIDGNTALILIDVQQGFEDPYWGKRNNPDAESNIARLLGAWRAAGRPVFHVRHDSVQDGSPLNPSTPGNRIKAEAAPMDGEPLYPKSVNSAFIGTRLEKDLRAQGIGQVVIAGLTTNHCVSTTARMAGNLGFRTFVVSDATAAFERNGLDGRMRPAEEVHASALSDLHGEFATIVATEEILRG